MIRLQLRVSTGAASSADVGRHGESWKVRVAAAPERGQANDAVVDLLARTLLRPRRSVTLVSGATARDKVLGVQGIARERADQLLAAAAETGGSAA